MRGFRSAQGSWERPGARGKGYYRLIEQPEVSGVTVEAILGSHHVYGEKEKILSDVAGCTN